MHVVEVSQSSATIRIADGCLKVSAGEQILGKVPLEEIATLLVSSPHAVCTVAALAALASNGTAVIVCDQAMRPAGMMLPFREHSEIATRIAAQARASLPLKKRLWGSLIRSKIAGQAAILEELRGSPFGLDQMARAVRPGDAQNLEARAARRYWSKLFGTGFRRRPGETMTNKMLDYGYAVLRAAVTRSICTAGLHPSLSIQHHHRANAFALADDLIEPFRPVVDKVVVNATTEASGADELTPALKRVLAGCLEARIPIEGIHRTVADAVGRSASSLAGVFLGEKQVITLPWTG
jgi:CRISPR-associated protein Cas1